MRLLTLGNPKVQKGLKFGYLNAILHLKPSVSVCPDASKGCLKACLNTAGRGGMFKRGERTNAIQNARRRRTRYLVGDEDGFMADLVHDMETLKRKAKRMGLKPCLRPNGTSDIPWEQHGLHWVAEGMGIKLYDYTKSVYRAINQPYSLHFSRSEENIGKTKQILKYRDCSVVVVSRSGCLDTVAEHLKVDRQRMVDGDLHDLRFLDPPGSVVVVKAKGRAIKDTSGFVLD